MTNKSLPEITFVSASIPAAVISMGILSLFKKSNILENNIVQTAASAGESLAAGVIFTIPALILLGYWENFDYWEVAKIAGIGGVIGVLFTVPLRRALIVEAKLQYPEGVATAEVLRAGEEAKSGDSPEASAGLRIGRLPFQFILPIMDLKATLWKPPGIFGIHKFDIWG